MSSAPQRLLTKAALVVYAVISVLYPLAHRDTLNVASEHRLSTRVETVVHDGGELQMCPAHAFAAATTGVPASSFELRASIVSSRIPAQPLPADIVPDAVGTASRAPPLL